MPVKLVLVGDGPDRAYIERAAREDGISEDLIFLGKQGAVEQILPAADVFLMPSETESFGLAALEAMACGLPVVVSNAGGLPELVCDGQCGLFAEIGDTDTLAAHVLSLLQNPARHQQFSDAAYERAREFDVNSVVPRYEAYYQQVVAEFKARQLPQPVV